MAHFAELDDDNMVVRVLVVNNNDLLDSDGIEREHLGIAFCESLFGSKWKQTSYSGSFRNTFAGPGYRYDPVLDAFFPPDSISGQSDSTNITMAAENDY